MTADTEAHLVLGDSREAATLLPELVGRIALAVTSPPYHNAISYTSHADDPTENYRTRDDISYAEGYLPFLNEVWSACHHMLRPGGHLAVNVGTVLLDGYHFPLPQDIIACLDEADEPWEYIRSILWNKVTAGVRRAGSVIKYQMPGYWYPNIMTEHIIVVRKPGKSRVTGDRDVPSEWWLPVWDLAPVPPRQIPHPAPFPEDLPHRLIRMLTNPGDFVLDPFLGAGATAKAASDLGRRPVGFDIEPKYLDFAAKRLAGETAVRPSQLRVRVIAESEFTPGRSRGKTRHGAGLKARAR